MLKSHALLLKYRHDARFSFGNITVWYVDRGAPGDRSQVSGADISDLSAHYFEVASDSGTKCIPYHRIRRIAYAGATIWER